MFSLLKNPPRFLLPKVREFAVVHALNALTGDFYIGGFLVNADIVPPEFFAGHARSAGTHEWIENGHSRLGILFKAPHHER